MTKEYTGEGESCCIGEWHLGTKAPFAVLVPVSAFGPSAAAMLWPDVPPGEVLIVTDQDYKTETRGVNILACRTKGCLQSAEAMKALAYRMQSRGCSRETCEKYEKTEFFINHRRLKVAPLRQQIDYLVRQKMAEKITLTYPKALEITRRLWAWLEESGSRCKRDWPEWVFNGGTVPRMESDCPCCQVVFGGAERLTCLACPAWRVWPYPDELKTKVTTPCNHLKSPYTRWHLAGSDEDRMAAAREIREGVERIILETSKQRSAGTSR